MKTGIQKGSSRHLAGNKARHEAAELKAVHYKTNKSMKLLYCIRFLDDALILKRRITITAKTSNFKSACEMHVKQNCKYNKNTNTFISNEGVKMKRCPHIR